MAKARVAAILHELDEARSGARSQELQESEAFEESARAQLEAASATLDPAIAGPRRETVEAAKGMVEHARGNLMTAEASFNQTGIISPCDGRITLRDAEPGELVTPDLPIVHIARLDKVWLRVFVPEPDYGLVKLGQNAEVFTDSHKKPFSGKVIEIAGKPEFTPKNVQTKGERVKLVFGIKVGIDNPSQDLKPGMPADAIIFVR